MKSISRLLFAIIAVSALAACGDDYGKGPSRPSEAADSALMMLK